MQCFKVWRQILPQFSISYHNPNKWLFLKIEMIWWSVAFLYSYANQHFLKEGDIFSKIEFNSVLWTYKRKYPSNLILLNSKKELSQISRTTRQKMIKICENVRQGNSNHHERFHSKRENISARYNDLKFVAIFG